MSETILPCPKCKAQRVHTVSSGPDINGIKRKSYTCTKCNLNTLRGRRGEVIVIEGGKPASVINGPQAPEGKKCPHCKGVVVEGAPVPVGFKLSGLCKECRKEFWKKVEPVIKEFANIEKIGEEI